MGAVAGSSDSEKGRRPKPTPVNSHGASRAAPSCCRGTVQPDFQYVWNPGGNVPDSTGRESLDNATVVGARTTISF